MFSLFVGALVVGAVASGVGGAISSAAQRRQAREQARYQKAQNEARRQTTLGQMERDLTSSMEDTYQKAGDITDQINDSSTIAMKNTYLGQLSAENQFMDMREQNNQAVGDMSLQAGASGAEEDVTLQTVINARIQEQENDQRTQINASRDLSTYQMRSQADQAFQTQDRMLSAYKPGDAIMRRYQYNRERVNTEADITSSYMSDVIKANKYNATWFAGDVLGFVAGAAGAGQTYSMGAGQFSKAAKPKTPVGWGSTSTNMYD